MRFLLCSLVLVSASACAAGRTCAPGAIISPEQTTSAFEWSAEEKAAPAAIRNLNRTPGASYHLVRVSKELSKRKHRRSDLVMFAISGRGTVRVDEHPFDVAPGSVVEIPRDVPYDAMAARGSVLVFYFVYTPPLASNDTEQVTQSRVSAWRWNLWVQ